MTWNPDFRPCKIKVSKQICSFWWLLWEDTNQAVLLMIRAMTDNRCITHLLSIKIKVSRYHKHQCDSSTSQIFVSIISNLLSSLPPKKNNKTNKTPSYHHSKKYQNWTNKNLTLRNYEVFLTQFWKFENFNKSNARKKLDQAVKWFGQSECFVHIAQHDTYY